MSDLSVVEKFIVDTWPTKGASAETWRRRSDEYFAILEFDYRTERLSFEEFGLLRDAAQQASARYQLIFFDQLAEFGIPEKVHA